MKRIQQAIGKVFFCLRISNGWSSFYRLVLNSKQFSRYYRRMEESGKTMQLQGQEPPDTTPDLQTVPASTDVQQQPATHLKNGDSEQQGYNEKPGYNQQAISDKTANNEQPERYQFKLRDKANQTAAGSSREVYLRTYAGDIQVFYDLMLQQSYEVAALNHAKNLVIVDAGANIGMAALYFLHHYHVSKIFCIEPDAKNLQILKLNLESEITNRKAIVIDKALASQSETMAWNNSGWAYNARLESLLPSEGVQGNQTPDQNKAESYGQAKEQDHKQTPIQTKPDHHSIVNTTTIEDFLRDHDVRHVDLLKIDVEGAEDEIFRGELSWLNKVQRLIIEIHNEPAMPLIKSKLMQAGFDFRSYSNSPYSDIYLAVKKNA